ncbi:MAG TPA: carboxypeptidase-like regulatory domain-containing protein, partial [Gemmatimonadaceae bacterium]|nr:carboxypeptidase-like regulatory domain-containing protein [Gemmatimonadaceae bacterium]
MKRLLSAILVLMCPAILHAQASVHGTVIDQQTGAPIFGASVIVTGTTIGTTTSDAGTFTVMATSPITSLTVSSLGYTTDTVSVTNESEALRIRLVPSPVELPGVQVLGNRPTPSTAVLTEKDLRRASGLNLESSVNTVPGIYMQSRTPFGGSRIT